MRSSPSATPRSTTPTSLAATESPGAVPTVYTPITASGVEGASLNSGFEL